MPDITYPNTFVAGNVTDADDVDENLYNPLLVPNSLDVLNGWLDSANVAPGQTLRSTQIRDRGMANGAAASSSTVLDYTSQLFSGTGASIYDSLFSAIPGGCREFYLPFNPSMTFIMWQVCAGTWIHRGAADVAIIKFYLDGSYRASMTRNWGTSMWSSTFGTQVTWNREPRRDRTWSGCFLSGALTSGWHTAELRCYTDNTLFRIRCRNMIPVWFR